VIEKKSISKTVLICEDNHMNFFVLQKLIQNAFPQVEILHGVDGLEGIKLFDNNDIDVLITDIEMPQMDGWELIDELKTKGYDMRKVVVVSAQSVEMLHPNAAKFGVKKCYSKPINPKAIEEIGEIINLA
jgi:CheY-like chemotaxis protein